MIVVADTSPLNYLVLISEVDLLQRMYGSVVVPTAVRDELMAPGTPSRVRAWAGVLPEWVVVRTVEVPANTDLGALDAGEAEAIVLAEAMKPDVVLLMDERKGRQEATRRDIRVLGTLGVLGDAAALDHIDLPAAVARLGQTTFRVPSALLHNLLERDRRRREGPPPSDG